MKKNYKEPANKVIELAGADAVLLNTSGDADPTKGTESRQNAWDDDDEEDW